MDALALYLKSRDESLSAFASRIGRSPSTLMRALAGARDPSFKLARDVEIGTGFQVSAIDFLRICFEAQSASVQEDISIARGQSDRPASFDDLNPDLRADTVGPSLSGLSAPPAGEPNRAFQNAIQEPAE